MVTSLSRGARKLLARGLALVKGRTAAAAVAFVGVVSASSSAFASYTSPIPTELQPTAIVAAALNEGKIWILAGLGISFGLFLLAKIVGSMKRKVGSVVSQ